MYVITIDASLGQPGHACRAVRHDGVVCLSHVPLVNESCHTCVHESCHTHTHTHMSVSRFVSRCMDAREEMCHVYVCAMTCSYVWHDSVICVPQLIYMRDMTYSYV